MACQLCGYFSNLEETNGHWYKLRENALECDYKNVFGCFQRKKICSQLNIEADFIYNFSKLNRHFVLYVIICPCYKIYIGETEMTLAQRWHKHMKEIEVFFNGNLIN